MSNCACSRGQSRRDGLWHHAVEPLLDKRRRRVGLGSARGAGRSLSFPARSGCPVRSECHLTPQITPSYRATAPRPASTNCLRSCSVYTRASPLRDQAKVFVPRAGPASPRGACRSVHFFPAVRCNRPVYRTMPDRASGRHEAKRSRRIERVGVTSYCSARIASA